MSPPLQPVSKLSTFNLSMDSLSSSPSGSFDVPPLLPPIQADSFTSFEKPPFSAAVTKPFAGGNGDSGGGDDDVDDHLVDLHNLSVSSMMQPGAHGGRKNAHHHRRRPTFHDFSSGYLDFMTQCLWNGAVSTNSAAAAVDLNVSTASSDGWNSAGESAAAAGGGGQLFRCQPAPLYGGNRSFFGDFGTSAEHRAIPTTPPKSNINSNNFNNSFGGFPQKKAASERKPPRPKKCAYCKGPHQAKDKDGVTICPELRALKCPVCNNTNPDLAHTVR